MNPNHVVKAFLILFSVVLLVSCAWHTAQLIETNDAGDALDAHIVYDAAGNAIAVWKQSDGTRFSVWTNRFSAASSAWGTAQLIGPDDAYDAQTPRIAVDRGGNAIAVWAQSDGTHFTIWANRFAGGVWDTAREIQTSDASSLFNPLDAVEPQIAFDGSGNAIAMWAQSDGTRFHVWANRFKLDQVNVLPGGDAASSAVSGTWGTAQQIETDDAGGASSAQFAFDAGGNAIAVWAQSDGTSINIWANRFTPGLSILSSGTWGTARLIETNAGYAIAPQIAVGAGGDAIAVWSQSDGVHFHIRAKRFSAVTGWGTDQLLETNSGNAESPQIAVDAGGNAIAVWRQPDGAGVFSIWANRYSASSGTWGTALLIETNDAGWAFDPRIAIDGSGNAIAVWHQSDGARFNIWANRFSAGSGTWGTAELIENDNAGNAFSPQIAVAGSGNAIAVWQQSDGTRFNIWANRFF